MAEANEELVSMIAMLQADFVSKLPADLAEVEYLWGRLLGAQVMSAELNNLIAKIHGIAGAGAMFYQPAVSALAQDMEIYLETILAARRSPNCRERQHFERLMADLKNAF